MKIGLALSGGGIKSLAQLPIIKTMLDENIEIDFISGTSMGSTIAALVASGIDILDIYQIILDQVRQAKGMGQIKTKDQEIAFVQRLMEKEEIKCL